MTDFIEPLASPLWFRRVAKIADGSLGNVEHALRHAFHLLQLAPVRFRDSLRVAIDEDCFEELLTQGDFETAARHLIAQPAALTVERQASQASFRATIGCAILQRTVTGTGETAATAVIAAWTTCLLALESDSDLLSRPEHINRHEQDRRLS